MSYSRSRLHGRASQRLARRAAVAALVPFLATGCGGEKQPLNDAEAEPAAILKQWETVACSGAEVGKTSAADLEGDEVGGADCELDIPGTRSQKTQWIRVFDSAEAVDTFLVGRDCEQYLYVSGSNWVAGGSVREIATDLVKAGGKLC